jgi:hypothetical protein
MTGDGTGPKDGRKFNMVPCLSFSEIITKYRDKQKSMLIVC